MSSHEWKVVVTKKQVRFFKGDLLYHKASTRDGSSVTYPKVLLNAIDIVESKPKRRRKDYETDINATQFAKAYEKQKRIAFKNKKLKVDLIGSHLKHFVKAAALAKRHDVPFNKFIKAQVAGLKWVDNGRGRFPAPNQLHTEAAETRLLEYLNSDKKFTNDSNIQLSKEDKELDLDDNLRFITRITKIEEGMASLHEALYVKALQQLKMGSVQKKVLRYIKKLESENG